MSDLGDECNTPGGPEWREKVECLLDEVNAIMESYLEMVEFMGVPEEIVDVALSLRALVQFNEDWDLEEARRKMIDNLARKTRIGGSPVVSAKGSFAIIAGECVEFTLEDDMIVRVVRLKDEALEQAAWMFRPSAKVRN